MKAINFLEWFKTGDKDVDVYQKRESYLEDISELNNKVSDFYSQPFKPELITELFEGWYKGESQSEYSFRYEADGYALNLPNRKDPANGDYIDYESTSGECDFIYPRTLNDFISDCQRAGIELVWREEIERKYFV